MEQGKCTGRSATFHRPPPTSTGLGSKRLNLHLKSACQLLQGLLTRFIDNGMKSEGGSVDGRRPGGGGGGGGSPRVPLAPSAPSVIIIIHLVNTCHWYIGHKQALRHRKCHPVPVLPSSNTARASWNRATPPPLLPLPNRSIKNGAGRSTAD